MTRWILVGLLAAASAACSDSIRPLEMGSAEDGSNVGRGNVPRAIPGGTGLPVPISARVDIGAMLVRSSDAHALPRLHVGRAIGEYSGLAWETKATGEVVVWYIDRWQPVEAVKLAAPPAGWRLAAAADFDTDGEGDLLFENSVTGERALWMMWDGAVITSASLGLVPTLWTIRGAGNADGDGYSDIIWQNAATGQTAVWYVGEAEVYSAVSLGQLPSAYPELLAIGDPNANTSGVPTNRFDTRYFQLVVGNRATGAMAEWVLSDRGEIVAGRESPASIPSGSRFGALGELNGCNFSDWVVHDQMTGDVFYQPDPTTSGGSSSACANGARIALGTVDPSVWKLVAGLPLHSPTKGVLVFAANKFDEKYWRTTGCVGLCSAFTARLLPDGERFAATRPTVFRNLTPGTYRIDLRCQVNFSFEQICPVGGNSTQDVAVTAGGRTEVRAVFQ